MVPYKVVGKQEDYWGEITSLLITCITSISWFMWWVKKAINLGNIHPEQIVPYNSRLPPSNFGSINQI